MTLQQLFDFLASHPVLTLGFLLVPPVTAGVVGVVARGHGFEQPWRSLYAVLIYASCIPGIFAATLMVYLFLFERQSIFAVDLVTQLAPILCMTATLLLIRRNVDLAYVPGFGRLSGLLAAIAGVIFLMYIAERLHIVAFTYLPALAAVGIFAGALALVVWGWRKLV